MQGKRNTIIKVLRVIKQEDDKRIIARDSVGKEGTSHKDRRPE